MINTLYIVSTTYHTDMASIITHVSIEAAKPPTDNVVPVSSNQAYGEITIMSIKMKENSVYIINNSIYLPFTITSDSPGNTKTPVQYQFHLQP